MLHSHSSADPFSFSPSPEPSSPANAVRNPWGSFFSTPYHPGDPSDHSDAAPSSSDLDQQVSQRLLHEESSSSVPPCFPHTQDANISPAAMFLAAFTPPTQSQPSTMPDDEGESVAGYVLGPVIGRGGFSIIRRAYSPSGGVVAIKIVRRLDIERQNDPSFTRKRLDHETETWSSLSHEHILPLFTAEHTPCADFYVTLYCPAGSLFDILKRDGSPGLPHDDVGMMFRQVIRGVRYLHEVAGYVHRDIKLENILVDEMGVCRLCDFGLTLRIGELDDEERSDHPYDSPVHRHRSTIHHTVRQSKASLHPYASILRHGHVPRRHRTSTPIGEDSPAPVHPAHAFQPGSLPYAAPELLSPQTHGKHGANPAQDMWALGCLLYALLTGRLPFSDQFEPRLTMKILHGVYDLPSNIGRGAARVLKGCLEPDLQHRLTIAMVDEIAWDIGLEEAHEAASVSHADDAEFTYHQPPTTTRRPSRSRNGVSLERISPLPPRSLSRTSATTSSSLLTRSTGRSASRPRTSCMALATACDDVEHARASLDIGGPALLSPTSPVQRGRSPRKADTRLNDPFAPSVGTSRTRSNLGCDPGYGREMYSGADALDNTARWASALGPNPIAEVTTHLNGVSPATGKLRRLQSAQRFIEAEGSKRAESTPPASSAWPLRQSRASAKDISTSKLGQSSCFSGAFLREPSSSPIPIFRKNGTRSRSVGYEPTSAARRFF